MIKLMSQILKILTKRKDFLGLWLEHFFVKSLNGIDSHEVIFMYDSDPIKRRERKIDTGTQIVLEVKKNKLNNSSKYFT